MQRTECRGDTFKQVSFSIFSFRRSMRKSTVNICLHSDLIDLEIGYFFGSAIIFYLIDVNHSLIIANVNVDS